MPKNLSNTLRDRTGSVSILFIIFIVVAISFTYGIVAVAETLIQKKEAIYGAQSSANAAAFVYAQTFVKKMHQCVGKKIEEAMSTSAQINPDCDNTKLKQCAEGDFTECGTIVFLCFPDEQNEIQACGQDENVRNESIQVARSSAQTIAKKYELKHVEISLFNDSVKVTGTKELKTQLPIFGTTDEFKVQAESTFSLLKKD
ncbi:MAG: hypothetical protein ABI425_04025 [Patescibacteria group bacterium]